MRQIRSKLMSRSCLAALTLSAGILLMSATMPAHSQEAKKKQEPWGTIKGRIIWKGPIPKKKQFVTRGGAAVEGNQPWVINSKDRGVRDVFVWIQPLKKDQKLRIHPARIALGKAKLTVNIVGDRFQPAALALREGQWLEVVNRMKKNHCLQWQGHPFTNGGGNVIIPPGGVFVLKTLIRDYKLPVTLKCALRKWMNATVRVFDHPYFTVTDANGNFTIKQAPAGKCRLFTWHRQAGYLEGVNGRNGTVINIPADGVVNVGERAYEKGN